MQDRSARPSLRPFAPAGAAAGAPIGVLPTASFSFSDPGTAGTRGPVLVLREGDRSTRDGSDGGGSDRGDSAEGGASGDGASESGASASGAPESGASANGASGARPTPEAGAREERDNPFAAPPADRPDQPWRPRAPEDDGTRWSGRQPEPWRGGGWGNRPGTPPQGQGQGPGQGGPQQGPGDRRPGDGDGPGGPFPRIPRWDPTDPVQRHARYALMAGTWGLVLGLFLGWTYLALLLGALGLYWGISALRGRARTPQESEAALRAVAKGKDPEEAAERAREQAAKHPAAAPPPPGPYGPPVTRTRPQVPAAVTGIVTSALSLAAVASVFLFHFVYSDYFTCVDDAATHTSRDACESHLPKELRPLLAE